MVNRIVAKKERAGHRQRLRERFLEGVLEEYSDEMLLELLLTFAIGRKDVKPLAQELIQIFGSLEQVLSVTPDELYKVKGLGQTSITLLKVVDFIKSGAISAETGLSLTKGGDANQLKLFEDPPNESKRKSSFKDLRYTNSENQKTDSTPTKLSTKGDTNKNVTNITNKNMKPQGTSKPSKKKTESVKKIRRKFQISNGYLLEFDQLARLLHFMLENRDAKKISRKILLEDTGLANRQVESLVSMGAAIGLIKPGSQVLTTTGLLIAEHDIFLENRGALEWCHYVGAGSIRNLIWFEVFNSLLPGTSSMTQNELTEALRNALEGQYTKRTIGKHLYEEVRFVIDAYMERNFRKLEILHQSSDSRLFRRRYTGFAAPVLTAMIYDFYAANEAQLWQVGELAVTPGSPAMVFGLDAALFRQQVEGLHDRGWLRYETTHNLDQIRLKPGFSALEFLTAHFEDREPHEGSKELQGGTIA